MTISEIIRLYDFDWYNVHMDIFCANGKGGLVIKSKEDFNIFTDIFGDCDIYEIRPCGASVISLFTKFNKLSKEELINKMDEYFSKIGDNNENNRDLWWNK